MTGDDATTSWLWQSDCSISVASGSVAARKCCRLSWQTNHLCTCQKLLLSGRRSINNLQRLLRSFLLRRFTLQRLHSIASLRRATISFYSVQMSLLSLQPLVKVTCAGTCFKSRPRKGNFLSTFCASHYPLLLVTITFALSGDCRSSV